LAIARTGALSTLANTFTSPSAGDLLFIGYVDDDPANATITATGCTQDANNYMIGDGGNTAILHATSAPAGTVTMTNAFMAMAVALSYSGVNTTTPLNANAHANGSTAAGGTATISVPAITTTTNGCQIVVVVYTDAPTGASYTVTHTPAGGALTQRAVTGSTSWQSAAAFDDAQATAGTISAGTYTVSIAASVAGVYAYDVYIYAIAPASLAPTINTQPSNASAVIGSTATFTVAATASAGSLSYQWKLNGTNVSAGSGGTTASYTTATLVFGDNGGFYTVDVTDSNGTTTSSAAALTTFWQVTGPILDGSIGEYSIGESATPNGPTVASSSMACIGLGSCQLNAAAFEFRNASAFGLASASSIGACIGLSIPSSYGFATDSIASSQIGTGYAASCGASQGSISSASVSATSTASIGVALSGCSSVNLNLGSASSIGFGLAPGKAASIIPSWTSAVGYGLASCLGASIVGASASPSSPSGFGFGLANANGCGIAAGRPASMSLGLVGLAPVCFATGAATSLGAGASYSGAAVVCPSSFIAIGYGQASCLGGSVTGANLSPGAPAAFGIGLSSCSGYGIAAGRATSIGNTVSATSSVCIAPSSFLALGTSTPAANAATVNPGFSVSLGLSYAGAIGGSVVGSSFSNGIATAFGQAYPAMFGLVISAARPTALGFSSATFESASLSLSSAKSLSNSLPALQAGAVAYASPKSLGAAYALAPGVTLAASFFQSSTAGLGFSFASARGTDASVKIAYVGTTYDKVNLPAQASVVVTSPGLPSAMIQAVGQSLRADSTKGGGFISAIIVGPGVTTATIVKKP
jgi:hypothetical protein